MTISKYILIQLYLKCVFEYIFTQQIDTIVYNQLLYRTGVFVWSVEGFHLVFKTARKSKIFFYFSNIMECIHRWWVIFLNENIVYNIRNKSHWSIGNYQQIDGMLSL